MSKKKKKKKHVLEYRITFLNGASRYKEPLLEYLTEKEKKGVRSLLAL